MLSLMLMVGLLMGAKRDIAARRRALIALRCMKESDRRDEQIRASKVALRNHVTAAKTYRDMLREAFTKHMVPCRKMHCISTLEGLRGLEAVLNGVKPPKPKPKPKSIPVGTILVFGEPNRDAPVIMDRGNLH